VTDRRSNPVSYVYDDEGNVLKEIQYLNGATVSTLYTYSNDGYNNKTSELLPGNASPTTYVYGDPNNPRLVTEQIVAFGSLNYFSEVAHPRR